MKRSKKYPLAAALLLLLTLSAGTALAWAPGEPLVHCGTTENPDMCGICDLVVGFVGIANYGLRLAIFLALVAIVAGGVMYVVSGGNTGMTGMAKEAIVKSLIGMAIVLTSWLIVNSLMMAIGKTGSWVKSQSWGTYDCP